MKPELLAPAGSPEALRAAIAAGADAIYLGAGSHGARASAGFDDTALQEAIRLAHLHGRRIYVTVNTLTKQKELPAVQELLQKLVSLRADAVIVQDLGLAALIREEFPGLCVHASTQMSVHNAAGARMLMGMGISRAVLARECGAEEISRVADTGIEVEVFVHGALCVSVSGQCLFSAMIGGRSGNRGRCAQPCRMQYRYKGQNGALLSMHDLNTLEHLPKLLEIGAHSFKIEGRLKRAEYVYAVTAAYRRVLDRALKGLPPGDLQKEQEELAQLYSRGFTKGHALGAQDSALIGPERVSHLGLPLGSVVMAKQRDGFVLAQVKLNTALNNGDGLQVRGSKEQDCIYSGPPVLKGQTATLRLRELPRVGDTVWKLQDEAQLSQARAGYASLPPLQADAVLTVEPGLPSRLTVTCRGVKIEATGEAAQAAQKQPLTADTALKAIGKTGGTPFTLNRFEFVNEAPAFMPAAALNALRRDALALLEDALAQAHELPEHGKAFALPPREPDSAFPRRLYALLPPGMNGDAILAAGADSLIHCPDNYREGALEEQLRGIPEGGLWLLPRQLDEPILNKVAGLAKERKLRLVADNIGQLGLPGLAITGEGIPVWNEYSLRLLRSLGARAAVLSRELSLQEIADLPAGILELIVPVYGRAALMQLLHCPERQSRGLSKNKAGCTFCLRGEGIRGQALVDRLEAAYPLSPTHFDHTCLIALHHHTPTNLGAPAPKTSWLMDLRMIDPAQAVPITKYYAALMAGQSPENPLPQEAGRYLLGVE